MLTIITIVFMLVVGYAYVREGLFTSFVMFVSVLFSGLVAFNFYEPVTLTVEGLVRNSMLDGLEDFLVLLFIFCLCLGVMRAVSNNINKVMIDLQPLVNQIGAGVIGVATGYFAAGFFLCAMQTMPMSFDFLGFQPRVANEAPIRRYFPADREWLSFVRHASAYAFAGEEWNPGADNRYDRFNTFDADGTFELRYMRYRRADENGLIQQYFGEMDKELRME